MADDRTILLEVATRGPRWLGRGPLGLVGVLRLLLITALLGAWELGSWEGFIDPFFFSSPSRIYEVLEGQFSSGRIWPHMEATAREAILGLILGFAFGSILAWISVQTRIIGEIIEPIMLLFNAIPRVVLAPILIMWFGLGQNSKIASAFVLVFVVIFFAVYTGLKEVPHDLVNRVRMLGGGRKALLTEVYIPSVLVWVFSSLRVTVGFAFTGAVVAEFIASSEGLGYLLNLSQGTFNSSLMMATVVLIMAMIMIMFIVLQRLEDYLLRWKRAQ